MQWLPSRLSQMLALPSSGGTSASDYYGWSLMKILQSWVNGFWNKSSLKATGSAFHLGHGGSLCPTPSRTDIITIIHSNGFHRVQISFCECSTTQQSYPRLTSSSAPCYFQHRGKLLEWHSPSKSLIHLSHSAAMDASQLTTTITRSNG